MAAEHHTERTPEQLRGRLQQWRQAHPRATFDEIEEAVQQEVARWQAELVAELASNGPAVGAAVGAAEHDGTAAPAGEERPICAACGIPMQRNGTRMREILSRQGQPIRLQRAYYVCPACGAGVFPPR